MRHPRLVSVLVAVSSLAAVPVARAQSSCAPQWTAGFTLPSPNAAVNAALPWNDGSGPALFVGGDFTTIDGQAASGVARYTETSGWSNLGGGLVGLPNIPPHAQCFAVFDDGSGPALYMGGEFTAVSGVPCLNIARWNGTTWSPLGAGLHGAPFYDFVYALTVYDDGSGAKLYAAGRFTDSGGAPLEKIARWDGTSWSDVGGGLGGQPGDAVHALAVYDDGSGSGPMLYAGGSFSLAGGQRAIAIARWNGTNWSPVVAGANGTVRALRVFDAGAGPRLFAGGDFTALEVPANRLASFDGQHWSPVGGGFQGPVLSLGTFDAGAGPELYVSGGFQYPGPLGYTHIVKYTGGAFVAVMNGPLGAGANVLEAFDLAAGPRLFVGGNFYGLANSSLRYGVAYEGAEWSSLSRRPCGLSSASSLRVLALQAVHHGGTVGTRNYVAGVFDAAGPVSTKCIAAFDGEHWSSIGGLEYTNAPTQLRAAALAEFDFGQGPTLVVGGAFNLAGGVSTLGVARFDGVQWSPVGVGLGGIEDFAVHDDGSGHGPQLYASGYVQVFGSPSQSFVARFDGTDWVDVDGVGGIVEAIHSFDDGSGAQLYASVPYVQNGVDRIRRWNGTTWSSVGVGLPANDAISAFAVFDAGTGAALYAVAFGGRVLRWNGATWNEVFSVPYSTTSAFTFDDGGGTRLYVGGDFTGAGGPDGNGIVRWNGTQLESLGHGTSSVAAIGALEEPSGRVLYAVGRMTIAADTAGQSVPSVGIVRWASPCPGSGVAFCSGDGSASACPCGNSGASGHGCANSFDANGAQLVASGVPRVSNDSFALDAIGLSNSIVTFLQGSAEANGGQGLVFGDGLRCAAGSVVRLGTALASNGAAHHPNAGQQPVSIRGAIPSGGNVTRAYQVWYRDSPAFCTPSTFSLTNGVRTFWRP